MIAKKPKNKEVEEYVKLEGREVIVDWQAIESIKTRDADIGTPQLRDEVLKYLKDLDILSAEPNGNYGLYTERLSQNPHLSFLELYFTREEDAKAYKQARFSRARYPVSIRKLEVIE